MNLPEPLRSKLLTAISSPAARTPEPGRSRGDWIARRRALDAGRRRRLKMTTLGVDVAQGGADETVLARCTAPGSRRRCGGAASTRATARRSRRRGDRARARRRAGQHRPHRRLGRLGARPPAGAGHRVEPVVFSQGSPRARRTDSSPSNKRSELWWKFREALDPVQGDGIALPPDRGSRRSSPRRPGRCAATRS
jgi:hypothetical protein